MAINDNGYRSKIIERSLLITIQRHPECNISEIYKITHNLTGSPIKSIRRIKSVMIQRLQKHIDILEDSE